LGIRRAVFWGVLIALVCWYVLPDIADRVSRAEAAPRAVDGKEADSVARLLACLDDYKPGDIIKLTVWCEGQRIRLSAALRSGEGHD